MASFDDLVDPSSPEVAAIAWRMQEAVVERFPNALEQIDLGNRVAAYGVTERMSNR